MFCTTLLMAASMVIGQAGDTSPHYEHLKDLEYFVGDWEIVGKAQLKGDFEGLGELANTTLRQELSYRWMKNKSFLVWTARDVGDDQVSYQALIGWDPVKERIKSSDFNSLGAWLNYVHIKRDFGWVMEGTAVYPGDAEAVYRAEVKIIDKDNFRHEGKGTMKQGGKTSEITLVFEAKRK